MASRRQRHPGASARRRRTALWEELAATACVAPARASLYRWMMNSGSRKVRQQPALSMGVQTRTAPRLSQRITPTSLTPDQRLCTNSGSTLRPARPTTVAPAQCTTATCNPASRAMSPFEPCRRLRVACALALSCLARPRPRDHLELLLARPAPSIASAVAGARLRARRDADAGNRTFQSHGFHPAVHRCVLRASMAGCTAGTGAAQAAAREGARPCTQQHGLKRFLGQLPRPPRTRGR